MKYFVTAIDTDSGKTIVSAILCEALGADYWKPVQAGLPRDLHTVQALVSNPHVNFHAETFLLNTPASPHASAKADGIKINFDAFKLPTTNHDLIIEGAGGCLVPLNEVAFVTDLISYFNATVILVADLYLGSINHTLLTVEALRSRKLPIKGIIFNGDPTPESERIILQHTSLECLLRIKREPVVDKEMIRTYAEKLKENWHE